MRQKYLPTTMMHHAQDAAATMAAPATANAHQVAKNASTAKTVPSQVITTGAIKHVRSQPPQKFT